MLIVLDVLVVLLLMAAVGVVFEIKRRKKLLGFHWLTISLYVGIGLLFASTYLMLRYMHSPWALFGPLHLWLLVVTFILPFAMAYMVKGTKKAKLVAVILSAVLLLSPLTRPIFLPMVREMNAIKDWDMAIPFNLCNISALVYLVAILLDNKTLKNYMITFGLFGGIINNIQVHNTHINTFWYYLTWESYFVHILIITIPLFMILTGQIKPSVKHVLYNAIWVFAFFFLAGFLINPAWDTNFHFTRPIAFTEALIPTMENPLIIFGNPVDPLYMSIFAILVGVACVLVFLLNKFLYKRVRPKIT